MNKFLIICPFYNVEKWIDKTIKSILLQEYENYRCLLINDNSNDNSLKIAKNLISLNNKFIIVDNDNRNFSLKNIYEGIHKHSLDDKEIIIILDGDDFFSNKNVLNILNDVYKKTNCLLTYGSYVNLSNKTRGKFSKKIPQHIIENNMFRNYEWCTSHLRSFKAGLFKKININDLKDKNNNFYTITGDLAIMFPMLELASNRTEYIDEILYIWNDLNILNDHKKDNSFQIEIEKEIRSKAKYEELYDI